MKEDDVERLLFTMNVAVVAVVVGDDDDHHYYHYDLHLRHEDDEKVNEIKRE